MSKGWYVQKIRAIFANNANATMISTKNTRAALIRSMTAHTPAGLHHKKKSYLNSNSGLNEKMPVHVAQKPFPWLFFCTVDGSESKRRTVLY